MRAFLRRFLMHYGIYRRYPLRLLPALRNFFSVTPRLCDSVKLGACPSISRILLAKDERVRFQLAA